MMNRIDEGGYITTPCHGAPLTVLTHYIRGEEVPGEIICAADGCPNSWDAAGQPERFIAATEATE